MRLDSITCWEPTNVDDPMMRAAGRLYERTLAPDERIPWMWIEKAVAGSKPGGWRKHLILASQEGRSADPESLAGYVYGAFIPGYGGYLCYVGVADWARRTGVGTRLYEAFFQAMQADAKAADESLPFVVWESHRPEADAPDLVRRHYPAAKFWDFDIDLPRKIDMADAKSVPDLEQIGEKLADTIDWQKVLNL